MKQGVRRSSDGDNDDDDVDDDDDCSDNDKNYLLTCVQVC